MSVSLFRYLNIKVSAVHEQTLINLVRLSSETDKSNFSYQMLNHRLGTCSYRPQALRQTKRSSQQSLSSPHKAREQHRIKLFQSSCFEMEMSLPVVLLSSFISVPGLLHVRLASLCPLLVLKDTCD